MIATLTGLWSSGKIARWAEYGAFALAIFLFGFAYGQHSATKTAIDDVLVHESAEQAKQGQALIGWGKAQVLRVQKDDEHARAADDAVHHTLNAATTSAAQARDTALAALKAQKEKTDAIATRNAELNAEMAAMVAAVPAPGPSACALPPGTRRVLDQASGARDSDNRPGDNAPEAEAAGRIDASAAISPAASDIGLTCDQLARGYVALSEWGRKGWAFDDAWRAWARARFGDVADGL